MREVATLHAAALGRCGVQSKLWVGHLQTPANITTTVTGKMIFRVMISVALAFVIVCLSCSFLHCCCISIVRWPYDALGSSA